MGLQQKLTTFQAHHRKFFEAFITLQNVFDKRYILEFRLDNFECILIFERVFNEFISCLMLFMIKYTIIDSNFFQQYDYPKNHFEM